MMSYERQSRSCSRYRFKGRNSLLGTRFRDAAGAHSRTDGITFAPTDTAARGSGPAMQYGHQSRRAVVCCCVLAANEETRRLQGRPRTPRLSPRQDPSRRPSRPTRRGPSQGPPDRGSIRRRAAQRAKPSQNRQPGCRSWQTLEHCAAGRQLSGSVPANERIRKPRHRSQRRHRRSQSGAAR